MLKFQRNNYYYFLVYTRLYDLFCFFRYLLNTVIEKPHSKAVTSLCFCPPRPASSDTGRLQLVVTSSNDGKFKLWKFIDDTNICSKLYAYLLC